MKMQLLLQSPTIGALRACAQPQLGQLRSESKQPLIKMRHSASKVRWMARAVLYGRPLLARQVCVGPFALKTACPGVIGHLASSVSVRGEWLLALKVLIYYWRPVYVFSNTWTHCFHVRLSVVCAPGLATGLHRASCPRRDTRHQRS